MSWQTEGEGQTWMPVLNAIEDKYAIPTNLLARIAYQESHFRRNIIDGTTKLTAGAVVIMQLLPQFFPSAGELQIVLPGVAVIGVARHKRANVFTGTWSPT
jgi:soluble lytic murein transglycosylase-like protein